MMPEGYPIRRFVTGHDAKRAHAELGYAPQYDFERSIAGDHDGLERLKGH